MKALDVTCCVIRERSMAMMASLGIPSWKQILAFLRKMAVLREMAGSAA